MFSMFTLVNHHRPLRPPGARPPMYRVGPDGEPIRTPKRSDREGKRLLGTFVPEERYKLFKVVAALLGLNTDQALNRGIDRLVEEAKDKGHEIVLTPHARGQGDDAADDD